MYQHQDTRAANWQIVNGMTVYATDGTELGTVRNYDPHQGWLDVHRGWLFTKDFYVPLEAIDTVAEDGVTLRLTKDDLEHPHYNSPPSAPATAAYEEEVVVKHEPLIGEDRLEIDTFDRVTSSSPPTTH